MHIDEVYAENILFVDLRINLNKHVTFYFLQCWKLSQSFIYCNSSSQDTQVATPNLKNVEYKQRYNVKSWNDFFFLMSRSTAWH